MSLLKELQRRNVIRVATAYIVVAWLVIQVVETIFPAFGFSDDAVRVIVIVFAVGFIPALIIAWVFEFTPDGFKRDSDVDHSSGQSRFSARQLDRAIIVILVLGISFFALDKFLLAPDRAADRELEIADQARSEALIGHYGERSIAVLPFVNMSSDPEQEFFADGIAEEVLNLLAQIRKLRVISRSSAFTFKGKDIEIREIAERLDVGHILEGSVRKSGDQVRVTAQLIEAKTDTHLWSKTYDRKLENVFLIQDEIAADVAQNLELKLLQPLPKSRPTDPLVLALTQQAKQIEERRGDGTGRKMQQLLDQALEIDPDYVPAHEWMIYAIYFRRVEGDISAEEAAVLKLRREERILALEPGNGFVDSSLAWDASSANGELERAAVLHAQAVSKRPNDSNILRLAGTFARYIGRLDVAMRLAERSTAIDPLCYQCLYQSARTFLFGGHYAKAESLRSRFLAIVSNAGGRYHYGLMKLLQDDPVAAADSIKAYADDNPQAVAIRAMADFSLGKFAEAEAGLERLIATEKVGEEPLSAHVSAWMNNKELAFEILRNIAEFDAEFAGFQVFVPIYRNLYDDPRWDEWRASIDMSKERLDAIEFDVELPE